MDKQRLSLLNYSITGLVIVLILLMFFKLTQDSDIAFTRRVLAELVNGRQSAEQAIDWPHFLALGSDIGADYSRFLIEPQRQYYRKAFIINFSMTFKNVGGQLNSFTNWRIYNRDNTKTVISCLALNNKALLFTLSKKNGKRKLASIQWKE